VNRLVSKIIEKSSTGLTLIKKVVNRGMGMELREAIDLEVRTFLDYFPTDDPRKGLLAFQERRKPSFR
jgi:enoyl-CoA hydratase/carnithine racemase